MIKYFLSLCFLLFSVHGFSQTTIEDYFSSSPEQIATLAEVRDFLIGDIVHPLNGQP